MINESTDELVQRLWITGKALDPDIAKLLVALETKNNEEWHSMFCETPEETHQRMREVMQRNDALEEEVNEAFEKINRLENMSIEQLLDEASAKATELKRELYVAQRAEHRAKEIEADATERLKMWGALAT
jgi:1,6-anhydro-N-acetylmuramate kinase